MNIGTYTHTETLERLDLSELHPEEQPVIAEVVETAPKEALTQ